MNHLFTLQCSSHFSNRTVGLFSLLARLKSSSYSSSSVFSLQPPLSVSSFQLIFLHPLLYVHLSPPASSYMTLSFLPFINFALHLLFLSPSRTKFFFSLCFFFCCPHAFVLQLFSRHLISTLGMHPQIQELQHMALPPLPVSPSLLPLPHSLSHCVSIRPPFFHLFSL